MRLSHTRPVVAATFDEPNLVSAAGLVPVMRLARSAGLDVLAGELLGVPTDKGRIRVGRWPRWSPGWWPGGLDRGYGAVPVRGDAPNFDRPYAPSTLGSFLRAFRFGHVRQLDGVAARLLTGLAQRTPVLAGIDDGLVTVDVDDMVIEVHGYAKQGAGFGYTGVRGSTRCWPP